MAKEDEAKPKFLKRLTYGFISGIPAGFILYVLGSTAANIVPGFVPANLGAIGFGIGFGSALGIQVGKAIWE